MIPEMIETQLALPNSFLDNLARTASFRYKEYTIPKKTGGQRTIYHPARELKLVQKWLLNNFLTKLPVHPAATAYMHSVSIRQNAVRHVANNYLIRIDFKNFFPSLKGTDVDDLLRANRAVLSSGLELTEDDIKFVRRIVCRFGSLPIGAPTSPHVSNAMMREFDEFWTQTSKNLQVTYTRYADDLYFSTDRPNVLSDILQDLRKFLRAQRAPILRINEAKTIFSSRKRKRLTAGLVLTSDKKISIGRHKKRILKSLVWKLQQKRLTADETISLRGWVAYLQSVEPAFVGALERKYKIDLRSSHTWGESGN